MEEKEKNFEIDPSGVAKIINEDVPYTKSFDAEETVFKARIVQLRKENGLTQQNLAEMLGVTRAAVSFWESGTSEPDIRDIVYLGYIFDVSIDFLFGLTNVRKPNQDIDHEVMVKLEGLNETTKATFKNLISFQHYIQEKSGNKNLVFSISDVFDNFASNPEKAKKKK